MPATSLDLSQIKTDALSSAATFRSLIGLGTLATVTPTGTPSASNFLRGDFSWQTIDLTGYVPYSGATGAVNLGANSLTSSRGIFSTGTITSSIPALNVTQTWDGSAGFSAVVVDITRTGAVGAAFTQFLLDLRCDNISRFTVDRAGSIVATQLRASSSGVLTNACYSDNFFRLGVNGSVIWSNNAIAEIGTADLILARDAANTLAQRNSTSAQTLRIANTWSSATSFEYGQLQWASNEFRIGTSVGSAGGTQRNLVLGAWNSAGTWTAGLTVGTTGNTTINVGLSVGDNSIYLHTNGVIRLADYTRIHCPDSYGPIDIAPMTNNVTGVVRVYNTVRSLTNYERLECGQSYNGTAFIRTAAGGTGTRRNLELDAPEVTITGNVTVSAVNLVTDTTTGTKIGTGTTQKLGFFNATPVVQPTAVADATDAASVITQLNALLSRMRDLGLIAT